MNSTFFTSPVFAYPGGITPNGDGVTDFSTANGLLVAVSGTPGQLVLNTSTTVPAVAVVLDGQPANRQSTMIALSGGTVVKMVAGGAITQFNRVQQDAAGRVVQDALAGTQRVVVGMALDAATAAGQIIRVAVTLGIPASTW